MRVYPKVNAPVIVPPPVIASLPVQAPSIVVPPVVAPSVPVPPPVLVVPDNLVTKNSILNLSQFSIPVLGPEIKMKMQLNCPQIRKTAIELPFNDNLDSFLDLSKYIVNKLGLDPQLKAIIYNKKGQPFLYNLDLMHMRLPKLDFSEEIFVMFTVSPSTVDEEVV